MKLSHVDEKGSARMVDVSTKPITSRIAAAQGFVRMIPRVVQLVTDAEVPKGDVFAAARLAGILAAKRTGELIPLAHPLGLDHVEVHFSARPNGILISATAKSQSRTGVEMEALVAVSVAALTIYDMVKALDKSMVIEDIKLMSKSGGASGHYIRKE